MRRCWWCCFACCRASPWAAKWDPPPPSCWKAAPPHRRGLYVSLQNATQYFATLCAGLVGLVLANRLSPQELTAWGWRVAMLLGAAVVPFALVMRRPCRKRCRQTEPKTLQGKTRRLSRPQLWLGLLGLCMLASLTIATYIMNYMGTFGMHSLGIPASKAFGATVAVGVCATCGALLGGLLSDRLGRKPVMIGGSLLLLLLALPCFLAMVPCRCSRWWAPAWWRFAGLLHRPCWRI